MAEDDTFCADHLGKPEEFTQRRKTGFVELTANDQRGAGARRLLPCFHEALGTIDVVTVLAILELEAIISHGPKVREQLLLLILGSCRFGKGKFHTGAPAWKVI